MSEQLEQTLPKIQYLENYQPPLFTVNQLELKIDISGELTQVAAKLAVQRIGEHQAPLVLNGKELSLNSISLDNVELSADEYQVSDSTLTIFTDKNQFQLATQVAVDALHNTSLEGLYMTDGAYCTQCEAQGFRRISYFLDRPDVLCQYTTTIIANKDTHPILLSNGNKIASGELDQGKHYVSWQDPFNKPSYLFAMVAGDFEVLEDHFVTCSGRKVLLQIFVDRGNLDKTQHAMASLKRAMKWDEETFGLEYDLDIYMVVAVDFFNMGAMENKGLNIFNSKYVLANQQTATDMDNHHIESIIGHEYFHNWTGNRVTCRDWFQLSLKEGLTVFRDQLFSAAMGSPVVNRIDAVKLMRSQQFAEDAGPMAHPIRPEKVIQMNNFYTVTVYNKGAEVIRMIHCLLGEDGFRRGMDTYFACHDGTAVTCDDFVAAMEQANAVDLTQFRRWYAQAGTPIVTVEVQYNDQTNTYRMTLSQHTPATADGSAKLPFHIPFDIELLDASGQSLPLVINGESISSVLNLRETKQSFVFEQVTTQPIPVLSRNFSAPIKVDFDYSESALLHIIAYAEDGFSRWDAAQTLYLNYVKDYIADAAGFALQSAFIDTFVTLLTDVNIDKALLAELITLPSFEQVASHFEKVDVDGINQGLMVLADAMCQALFTPLWACYQANQAQSGDQQATAVAKRALKNECLNLLSHIQCLDHDDSSRVKAIMQEQYIRADNMTDTLAVLTACNGSSHRDFFDYMRAFEKKWQGDPLVMDKWFALHACWFEDDIFENIEKLRQHPLFNIENPNRVRALIGAFCFGNSRQFHRQDGRGYQLLADVIIQLNGINPQTASRLITPFMSYKRYDPHRQALIREQLERIRVLPDLSDDLYEKVVLSLI